MEKKEDGTQGFTRIRGTVPSVFYHEDGDAMLKIDAETAQKCRICLKVQGLEDLALEHKFPKSNVTIQEAVFKTFNFDVSLS